MNSRHGRLAAHLLATTLTVCAGSAIAESPMIVDDASTLERGGAKLEFGWSKDDKTRGLDAAVGYGPIENVELELAFGRSRDHGASPTDTLKAIGGAIKWVPLQSETGLSAGVKLEHVRENAKFGEDTRSSAITGLLTWRFEAGTQLHMNLGHAWEDVRGGDDSDVDTWGIGLDIPVAERLHLTLETFGEQYARPDRQIGLRYEIADGVQLSGGIGQGNKRHFSSLGVAWEF